MALLLWCSFFRSISRYASHSGVSQLWPMGRSGPAAWFVYRSPSQEWFFTLLNGKKNQEDYHWFCDTWKLNESQLSVHQQRLTGAQPAHLLPSCVWLLWYCVSRAEESPQRLYGLQRVKYLLSGPWQKKCADPCCSYKKKVLNDLQFFLHISLLDSCYNLKIKNCFIGVIASQPFSSSQPLSNFDS